TVVAESRKLPARVWRAVLDGILTFDSAAELRTLRCPTLIVWGDRDSAFPRDEQYRLRDGIAGARLTIYSETGHSPQWERPAQFVRDVLAFIASAPGDCRPADNRRQRQPARARPVPGPAVSGLQTAVRLQYGGCSGDATTRKIAPTSHGTGVAHGERRRMGLFGIVIALMFFCHFKNRHRSLRERHPGWDGSHDWWAERQ